MTKPVAVGRTRSIRARLTLGDGTQLRCERVGTAKLEPPQRREQVEERVGSKHVLTCVEGLEAAVERRSQPLDGGEVGRGARW